MVFLFKDKFHQYLKQNQKAGCLIGLDYGSKNIGVAMTNSNRTFALQLESIEFSLQEEDSLFSFNQEDFAIFKSSNDKIQYFATKWSGLFLQILQITQERNAAGIVIGLPIKMFQAQENIKDHVELFAVALDYFFLKQSLLDFDFQKIQSELEAINFDIKISEDAVFEYSALRDKINTFPILLQDERFSSKKVFADLKNNHNDFYNHYRIKKQFRSKCTTFDKENDKIYRNKKSSGLNKMKNFDKFQKNTLLRVKNSAAAMNILNAAVENITESEG
jgi:RNase H-fold protein (predicted Holliday junction resolvase)